MLLGDTDRLQLRADVDGQNAPLVAANQPAVACLKGDTKTPIPLRFVRIEPCVVPKRSLTGDSTERGTRGCYKLLLRLTGRRCLFTRGSRWMFLSSACVRRQV